MEILSFLAILTIFPFGATLIGTIYFWMFCRMKTITSLVTGIAWVLYSIYEYLMYVRILCTGECNIRIDLLVIYPVLIVMSLLASILYFIKKSKVRRPA